MPQRNGSEDNEIIQNLETNRKKNKIHWAIIVRFQG